MATIQDNTFISFIVGKYGLTWDAFVRFLKSVCCIKKMQKLFILITSEKPQAISLSIKI